MLTQISMNLAVRRPFRLIGRWLAMCLYVALLALFLLLFARAFLAMRASHSHWLNPESHMPMSPDSISYRPSRRDRPRRARED
jgi:hypothetical protein